jgi:Short C-terminal domain
MPGRRRGRPLARAAVGTAVVAGTAGAVHHHQEQKYAAQDQAAYDEQMAAQQAAAPAAAPAAPAEPDYTAELEKLAQLKAQGVITDEEFEAKKKQILGI